MDSAAPKSKQRKSPTRVAVVGTAACLLWTALIVGSYYGFQYLELQHITRLARNEALQENFFTILLVTHGGIGLAGMLLLIFFTWRGYVYLADRNEKEDEHSRLRDWLQEKVAERTAQLEETNKSLQAEIEERAASEERQRTIAAELETIFRESIDALVVCSGTGCIKNLNDSFCELLGFAAHELRGRNIIELLPVDPHLSEYQAGDIMEIGELFLQDFQQKMHQLYEQGSVRDWELSFVHKNGLLVACEANVSLATKPQGRYEIICVIRNISERKEAQAQMIKRIQELSMLNRISTTIFDNATQIDRHVETILEQIQSMVGLECGILAYHHQETDLLELKGVHGLEQATLKPGDVLTTDIGSFQKVFETRRAVVIDDVAQHRNHSSKMMQVEGIKSAATLPIMSRKRVFGALSLGARHPFHFDNQTLNMLTIAANQIGLAFEVSELFQETTGALAELKQAEAILVQSEKMASVGQLAAGVAHEINNPTGYVSSNLASLKKYSDKLREFMDAQSSLLAQLSGGVSADMQNRIAELHALRARLKIDYILEDLPEIVNESLEGTGRIKKIVADLKSFSRIDQEEFKPADINEGIESTLNVVWNELKYTCTIEKHYGELPLISCNHGQLNQVFMNLLVNAAHAIGEQGVITITTRYRPDSPASDGGGKVEVMIRDTGCGIPQEKLEKIFEPFYTTKEVGVGTGLGLSISYDIVKKHHGVIHVASAVGEGTTFTIVLPVTATVGAAQNTGA